jgi:hypothetical protein
MKKICDLQRTNQELTNKIDTLENNVRRNNVIIFGVKEQISIKEDPVLFFCNFTDIHMNFVINPENVAYAYRIGKNVGKRPLFVCLTNLKVKIDLMKNAAKLKGTGYSISDDLTPSARANKKLLLKSASQARSLEHDVKIRSDHLIVDGVNVGCNELKHANWISKIKDSSTFYNEKPRQPRKRTRQSVLDTDDESDPLFASQVNNDPPQGSSGSQKYKGAAGNLRPPLLTLEGGVAMETRSRSNSRGSQNKN